MKDSEQIDIYVLTRNSIPIISECLASLKEQTYENYTVTVIDGSSTDGTEQVIKDSGFELLSVPYDYTIPEKRQIALKTSTAKYVAFIDSDCIAPPNWLSNLIEYHPKIHDLGLGIVDVGATGGSLITTGDAFDKSIGTVLHSKLGAGLSMQGKLIDCEWKKVQFVPSLATANIIYNREHALSVGGFNTSITGCEDAELNSRLDGSDFAILYIPDSGVKHYHSHSHTINGQKYTGFLRWVKTYSEARGEAIIKGGLRMSSPVYFIPLVALLFWGLMMIFLPLAGIGLLLSYLTIMLLYPIYLLSQDDSNASLLDVPFLLLILHAGWAIFLVTGLIKGLRNR